MTVDKIEHSLDFPFDPEIVWRAISDPQEISKWFSNRASVEQEVGGRCTGNQRRCLTIKDALTHKNLPLLARIEFKTACLISFSSGMMGSGKGNE